jgi:antitoxin (DNA-binding transcriptional repressor) of toxin-antitoxin stability system
VKKAGKTRRVKKVGVRDLKNNLSAYLRDVRQGTRILVTDRALVTAELHEPGAAYAAPDQENPILAEWIESGILTPAAGKKTPLPTTHVRARKGTALRLINELREERPRRR